MYTGYIIGFSFSILGSIVFVRYLVDSMWKTVGWKGSLRDEKGRPDAWLSRPIGVLESILYTASWIIGRPEFIAVWLALKVAGRWGRWSEDTGDISGRAIYNIFLIGSGLIVLFSIVGALLIGWINNHEVTLSIVVPLLTITLSLTFTIYTKRIGKSSKKT